MEKRTRRGSGEEEEEEEEPAAGSSSCSVLSIGPAKGIGRFISQGRPLCVASSDIANLFLRARSAGGVQGDPGSHCSLRAGRRTCEQSRTEIQSVPFNALE